MTHGGVVGLLARALADIEVRPLDEALGRAAGALLSATNHQDVIDAALVLLAHDGDRIVMSDPGDIARLAAAADHHVEIVSI